MGGFDRFQALEPFITLFFFDRTFFVILQLRKSLGVPRPYLLRQHSQGHALFANGQRRMRQHPLPVGTRQGSQPLRFGMCRPIQIGRILHRQYHFHAGHPTVARLHMTLQYACRGHSLIVKEPVGGLQGGRFSAGIRQRILGLLTQDPGQLHQPGIQALVPQVGFPKFFFCPGLLNCLSHGVCLVSVWFCPILPLLAPTVNLWVMISTIEGVDL